MYSDEKAEGVQGKHLVEACGKQPPKEKDTGAFAVLKWQG